jgi:hypothetical protein
LACCWQCSPRCMNCCDPEPKAPHMQSACFARVDLYVRAHRCAVVHGCTSIRHIVALRGVLLQADTR